MTCCGAFGGAVTKKETERGEREETDRRCSPLGPRIVSRVGAACESRYAKRSEDGRPGCSTPSPGARAIPLEAMRLGCEVTASDLNPVAWFILRCTLHYPRLMAGQTRPLPDFAVRDRPFVEAFLEAQGDQEKERPALAPCPPRARRWSRPRSRPASTSTGRRRVRTFPGISARGGGVGVGRRAPGACLVLPDPCGVRAGQAQGSPRPTLTAAEAVQTAFAEAPDTGRAGMRLYR